MAILLGKRNSYLQDKWKRTSGIIILYFSLAIADFVLIFYFPKFATLFVAIFFILFFIAKDKWKNLGKIYRGARAENVVRITLKNLDKNFFVIRNIHIPGERSNIDFVVVGPTGIFSIEVKSHGGNIAFNGNNLTVNNKIFKDKNILDQANAEAFSLYVHLRSSLHRQYTITPVLVFSHKYATMDFGFKPVRGIFILNKSKICEFIENQKIILSQKEIKIVVDNLKNIISV